jgi:hypothetical protein
MLPGGIRSYLLTVSPTGCCVHCSARLRFFGVHKIDHMFRLNALRYTNNFRYIPISNSNVYDVRFLQLWILRICNGLLWVYMSPFHPIGGYGGDRIAPFDSDLYYHFSYPPRYVSLELKSWRVSGVSKHAYKPVRNSQRYLHILIACITPTSVPPYPSSDTAGKKHSGTQPSASTAYRRCSPRAKAKV